jgi:hypothetical protein
MKKKRPDTIKMMKFLKKDTQHLFLEKLRLMSSMTRSKNFKMLLLKTKECKLIQLAELDQRFPIKSLSDQRLEEVLSAKQVLA